MASKLALSVLLLLPFFAFGGADASGNMNIIDRCWRRQPDWAANRQRLAVCSVGFAGKMRQNRGRGMSWYTVTDPSDDPVSPRPGTLRYGATVLRGKVWITFSRDMQIKLQRPLIIKSFTTIDGRGADVQIAYGAGFFLNQVKNVIIHGLQFHHISAQSPGPVLDPSGKLTNAADGDGDAIRLVSSSKVWIDHNTLSQCEDGLLDVTRGSTHVTVSNNWFKDHDKVMLLGHDDSYVQDRNMKVTVAFNRFGPSCNQRMPRVRHGYAHVVNNLYEGWGDYAIGGSMNPSVRSEGNLFAASAESRKKVTSRVAGNGGWNWQSVNDGFENGAFFKAWGNAVADPGYGKQQMFPAAGPDAVRALTADAGALRCNIKARC